jgi:hypothetical protein
VTIKSVENEFHREDLIKLIEAREAPFTVEITSGKRRSVEQNRLQRKWIGEISDQLGDRTPEEVRGECKLRFGVPILRAENELFCEKYDRLIKPLPYETKLEMMMEPLDLPITRIMTVAQKTKYLESISRYFANHGVVLTDAP